MSFGEGAPPGAPPVADPHGAARLAPSTPPPPPFDGRTSLSSSVPPPLFPPALVAVLRERVTTGPLSTLADDLLDQLLTVVFFAGLETNEGERLPIRVAFIGDDSPDVLLPGADHGAVAMYRWKLLRFAMPRPCTVPELVKLSVVTAEEKMYCAVTATGEALQIAGFAREGANVDEDPFLKILSSRPGGLTIRAGRDRVLEYERGSVLTGGEHVVFSAGPVRRALEAAAGASAASCSVDDYLETVRALVREMAAHGRGGILIVHPDEHPALPPTPYRMTSEGSLSSMLGIARLIGHSDTARAPDHRVGEKMTAFGRLLRSAFLAEIDRVIEEIGVMTAIDGATVLDRNLAVQAFGVILPVAHEIRVAFALDPEASSLTFGDLACRGTRHRASATCAEEHPGAVVFVASEDGDISCMFRPPSHDCPIVFRLGRRDAV